MGPAHITQAAQQMDKSHTVLTVVVYKFVLHWSTLDFTVLLSLKGIIQTCVGLVGGGINKSYTKPPNYQQKL